ncbi:MAG: ABC transporter ATP-binding protein [Limnochordaceae bacterium]|nr:ABC transporter ATP-binding protein [Limnochordaceae bacterium]
MPEGASEGVATPKEVIRLEKISRQYVVGGNVVQALEEVDLVIKEGEFLAIMGPSGSGKSTLMHILGCLDRPTSGRYVLDGVDVGRLNDNQLAVIRNQKVGFVFQQFNLLPRETILANVELPMMYAGVPRRERSERARQLLKEIGLENRLAHRPTELSGGQRQRVAIARALANAPALILADEPTGNLDTNTGAEILRILEDLNRRGRTIVLVTHDPNVASHAGRVIRLVDGRIVADEGGVAA